MKKVLSAIANEAAQTTLTTKEARGHSRGPLVAETLPYFSENRR
jgi:hypothetical protein